MEELRCPVRAENRVAHAAFLREFRALASHFSLDGDPDEIAVKIKKMAAHWLSSHICRVDLKLRDSTDCVSAPGSGRTA